MGRKHVETLAMREAQGGPRGMSCPPLGPWIGSTTGLDSVGRVGSRLFPPHCLRHLAPLGTVDGTPGTSWMLARTFQVHPFATSGSPTVRVPF